MTEDEAKTKWCPFVRMSPENERSWPSTNREERIGDRPQYEVTRCIGSACMAWRGYEGAAFKEKAEAEYRRSGRRIESGEGFCGLAGHQA